MKRTLIGLFLIFGYLSPAHADSYYVETARGPGIAQEDGRTVTELIKNVVLELSHELVTSLSDAEYTLRPKLLILGASYIVTLDKIEKDKVIFSSRLKAAQMEELDEVTRRLTRSVINETSARKDVRVGEVSQAEQARGTRRRPAVKGKYFALGPASLSNLNTSGLGYYIAAAYAFDVNVAIIRIRADFTGCGGGMFGDIGLGGSYFFSDTDIAPFVGADFGYGLARIDEGSFFQSEVISGFVIGPIAGVHLLRTSAINLELAFRAAIMLNSSRFGNPFMFGGRVGLYF